MKLHFPTDLSGLDKAACAVALVAIICTVIELAWPHPLQVIPDESEEVTVDSAPDAQETETPKPNHRAIAERPLFTVDRRPYQIPVDDPLSAELMARQEADREPEVSFELRGVIRTSSANIALLLVSGQNTPTRLRPGEQLAGWTLREVGTESVRLERNGQEMQVVLHSRLNDPREG